MPRILFCCPVTVTPELGTAKVYIEMSEALRRVGWDVTLVGPEMIAPGQWFETPQSDRPRLLKQYLAGVASAFDVVDFDHGYLPYPRSEFPASTLLVARSVLLVHFFLRIEIPPRPGLRRWIGKYLYGPARRRAWEESAAIATRTCTAADLLNLCNDDEALELQRHGLPAEKMVVLPFGLSAARRACLETVDLTPPARPCVAFVGTFDPRKGMRDFPHIVSKVVEAVPDVRFKLLGTTGMLQSAAEVYAEFPRRLRPALDVVPRFGPQELPKLLADCSVGMFPSLVEGFPFGVLEMLAAGLPVIAYRAPGPPMMLPEDNLVPPGDATAMAAKLALRLRHREALGAARAAARSRSRDFEWDKIAVKTAAIYEERLACLRH
jgi:glycosyltransferase involved in cell wall biosynthesis